MNAEIKYRQIQHDGYGHRDVIKQDISTSWFDLSHSRLMTFDMGELVPMLCMEIVPGDYVELNSDILVRLAPLVAPLFHHLKLNTRYYFVPNRIMWNESGASFIDFITGGPNGTDTTVHPYIPSATYQEGTLADYLGIPIETPLQVNALPFRAYGLIYNEYFRNEDVQTKLTVSTNDDADSTTNTTLQNVNWEDAGDYFVGAFESLQRGTAVTLPLGTTAPVYGNGKSLGITDGTTNTGLTFVSGSGVSAYTGNYNVNLGTANSGSALSVSKAIGVVQTGESGLIADLSTATSATLAQIRNASATQMLLELLQYSGSPYRNYIQAIFGVNDYEDSRFQIPEVLGGKTSSVVVSEVLSTNGATGGGLAQMGGHGIAPHATDVIKRRFTEHGLLMGLMYIVPEAIYQEGLHRMFFRETKFDYLTPQLALIGNQSILNKEIYAAAASPTATFAYQRRYGEYMTQPSSVHGDFRSEADTSLEFWHLARDFSSTPSFNSDFLKCDPDKARIFTSSSTDCVYAQIVHYIKARRPLPKEDVPYKLI